MSMPFEVYPWLAGAACYAAYRLAGAAHLGRAAGKVVKAELPIDSPEEEQSCDEPTNEPCPEPQVPDSREPADGKGRGSRTRRVAVGSILVLASSVALAVLLSPGHYHEAATAEAPPQQMEPVAPKAPDPGHYHDEAAAEAPAHQMEPVAPTAPDPEHWHDEATVDAPAQERELATPASPDPGHYHDEAAAEAPAQQIELVAPTPSDPGHYHDEATAKAPAQQIELVTPTAPVPGHHHDEAAAEAPAQQLELVAPTAPDPGHYPGEATADDPGQKLELVAPKAPNPYIQEGHVAPVKVVGLHRQKMKKGVVGGVPYYKSAYYGDFAIGSPAKQFTMVFDTGSGNVIVPSTFCASETCRAHNRYSEKRSSTGRAINAWGRTLAPDADRHQIGVTFGTGHVEAVLMEDIMCSGNVAKQWEAAGGDQRDFSNMSAGELLKVGCQRMRMLAAIEMSEMPFKTFVFDGILGLGLKSLAVNHEFNFMHVLSRALETRGSSMPYTFAMYLEDDKEGNSEIAFGGWSAERLDGDLTWNDVFQPQHGHWLLRINKMRVDDDEVPFCADGTCLGVADSGTSLLAVPPVAFPEVFERLRHPAATDGFCVGGPRLYIELDHMVLELGAEDLARPEFVRVKRRFDPNSNRTSEGAGTREDVRCKPILMSLAIDGSFGKKLFIFGEPILRKYYTVYDTKGIGRGPRIGFGRAVRPPASELPDPENDLDQWFYETDDDEE